MQVASDFMGGIFVVDIETVGLEERQDLIPEPKLFSWEEAPKSYQRKTSNDVAVTWAEDKNAGEIEKYHAAVARMALDIDMAGIVAIGWKVQVGTEAILRHAISIASPDEEADMLTAFWDVWIKRAKRTCGYNVAGFDIPMLMRRSWVLGVPNAYPITARRYATDTVIDLMEQFYHWGYGPGPKYRGLKDVAQMYGIPIPKPDADGSMVAEMSREERAEYVLSDIDVTWELAKRMHGMYWS